MTSKRLFVNAMGEDLRHKIWMAALSFLGNVLALPVAWLILKNNLDSSGRPAREELYQIYDFFVTYMILMGGMVALPGAMVTGLAGFRFVFHKRMVDLYHSLPVKRSTLYGVCYVNGILIWLVPFVICLLSVLIMGGSFAWSLGGTEALWTVLKNGLLTFLVLALAYLLVYHMVLLAAMLSGNALNALVSVGILGFGSVAVYGMVLLFFSIYMGTFLQDGDMGLAGIGSPLFSALYLLYSRAAGTAGELGKLLLENGAVMVFLGFWAWRLYCRRTSDLSEQGLCSRAVSALLRGVAGILGGMCGWLLMATTTTDAAAVGWGVFGAVLAAAVVFGILDIVFRMEFRAFFAHKIQMGLIVGGTLLCCLAFYGDWFGYDSYLPRKDQVTELALLDINVSNRSSDRWADPAMENMSIRDRERIYAYLEAAVARANMPPEEYKKFNEGMPAWEDVRTKVTLENGRSYYRSYSVTKEEKEVLWKLFTSREYLEQAYCISEEMLDFCVEFNLGRKGRHTIAEPEREDLSRIVRAYNQDVLADPETVLSGRGRLLTQVRLSFRQGGESGMVCLDVYEGMSRTVEALKQTGFQDWVEVEDGARVQAVLLPLGCSVGESVSPGEIIELARKSYGVYNPEQGIGTQNPWESDSDVQRETLSWEETEWEITQEERQPVLYVTDRAEVEELLGIISYMPPFGSSIFRGGSEGIEILGTDGGRQTCYILEGMLPEKYVTRFGSL